MRAISAGGTHSTVVGFVHDIGLVGDMGCLSVASGRLAIGSTVITVRVDAGYRKKSVKSIARMGEKQHRIEDSRSTLFAASEA